MVRVVYRAASLLCAVLAMASSVRLVDGPQVKHGVAVVASTRQESLSLLGPVWYYGYSYEGEAIAGHQRVYMVRPGFDERSVARVLKEQPGQWWIVGNEPNDPFQDNLSPTAYAAFFDRFSALARRHDPQCRLVVAGIANADVAWAQAFVTAHVEAYGAPPLVEAWNIHCYLLEPSGNPLDVAAFRRRVSGFREWMVASHQGDLPLWVTEFGVLCAPNEEGGKLAERDTVEYMRDVVVWLASLDYVTAWAWFANDTSDLFWGDLFDGADLTACGLAFRDIVADTIAAP